MRCSLCQAENPTSCNRRFCPVMTQRLIKQNIVKRIDKEFYANSPPSIFIGSRLKYPEVSVGILSPLVGKEEAEHYDNPYYWTEHNYSIEEVAGLRSSLINSRFPTQITNIRSPTKLLDLTKEVGLAKKAVHLEITLKKKLQGGTTVNKIHSPFGPTGPLQKATATENISRDQHVEKVTNDTDMKAVQALMHLYKRGFKEHQLTQILSVGSIGLKKNRRLVPTRFSITATDDTIGKELLKEIKNYQIIKDYLLFEGNFFGNYYFIAVFPEVWSYELFEGYIPGSIWNFSGQLEWSTDSETVYGRKNYASNTVGGYYAARLPILEYLKEQKRQASILVIRLETPEYSAPLGVWVVRTAAQKTMKNQPLKYSSKEELLKEMKEHIKKRFGERCTEVFERSKLVKTVNTQKKLFDF